MGDIIVSANELPIIRGGWLDRNDIYYNDSISDSGLSSVNIMFNSIIKRK